MAGGCALKYFGVAGSGEGCLECSTSAVAHEKRHGGNANL